MVCTFSDHESARRHRLRFTLYDGLQIKHLNELIAAVCYAGAVVGSAVAAYLLFITV